MKLLFIAATQVVMITTAFAANTNFVLEEAKIADVHRAISNHQITCVQLIHAYLDRIKKYNLSFDNQPPINAYTEINPYALQMAKQLDEEFAKTNKLSGALHCIPVILKDNIDSYDTTTTAGSYALLGNQPIHDSAIAANIRRAGGIIIGKGGMDEFAMGMFGFSSRSGRIGNAYQPNSNPGGSSGGSAAAVSANFAMVGVGSDNSGSVRIPAAFNGLVGLRPSMGLISNKGMFPMGNIDGTAGPLARTTEDLAILLSAITDKDYRTPLTSNGFQGKRIGIVKLVGNTHPFAGITTETDHAYQEAYIKMRELGATFIEISLPNFDNNRENNQAGEVEDVNGYLAAFPATRKNFTDICESGRTRSFGKLQDCLQFIKKTPTKNSQAYRNAHHIIAKNNSYIERVMQENHLDALLLPITTQGTPTYDGNTVKTWSAPVSSNSGIPAIAFIIGYSKTNNLPIGIELDARKFAESTLLAMAYTYEKNSPPRKTPTMPAANPIITKFNIPQLNNLFSLISQKTFDNLIKNAPAGVSDEALFSPSAIINVCQTALSVASRDREV